MSRMIAPPTAKYQLTNARKIVTARRSTVTTTVPKESPPPDENGSRIASISQCRPSGDVALTVVTRRLYRGKRLLLAARHRSHHPEDLGSRGDRVRQGIVRGLVRHVLPAGEEADEVPALRRPMIADRSAENRVLGLQRVEHGAPRRALADVEVHFAVDAGERPKVLRKDDADHARVCASTDSTAGRSWTIAVQLSPLSADE